MPVVSIVSKWELIGAKYIQVFYFLVISMIPIPMCLDLMVSLVMAVNASLRM